MESITEDAAANEDHGNTPDHVLHAPAEVLEQVRRNQELSEEPLRVSKSQTRFNTDPHKGA